MTSNELVRLLTRDGWVIVRQGKHAIFRHPVKTGQLTVPMHGNKDVATGTLNSILKAAGLR